MRGNCCKAQPPRCSTPNQSAINEESPRRRVKPHERQETGKTEAKKPPSLGHGCNALMSRPPRQRISSSREGEAPAHAALAPGTTRRGGKETAWREWDGGKEGALRHTSFILLLRQFVYCYPILYHGPQVPQLRALLTFCRSPVLTSPGCRFRLPLLLATVRLLYTTDKPYVLSKPILPVVLYQQGWYNRTFVSTTGIYICQCASASLLFLCSTYVKHQCCTNYTHHAVLRSYFVQRQTVMG
jgi:hypothetical protein